MFFGFTAPLPSSLSRWRRFWMRFAGRSYSGRMATRLATWFTLPQERYLLAQLNPRGYIAPNAIIHHSNLCLGEYVFIGERVLIRQFQDGGPVELDCNAFLSQDIYIYTVDRGSIKIGANTFINLHSWLVSSMAPIQIGNDVLIGPHCAFYSANHGIAPGEFIRTQPLKTRGGIIVEDDVWLGHGVTVLDGVRIGKGAVVGAGAVVTHDIPAGAIAAGVPARVTKMRSDLVEPNPRSAAPVKVDWWEPRTESREPRMENSSTP